MNEERRQQLLAVLEQAAALEWAILFGSHARGTARPDSDVDIAISTTRPLSTAEEHELTLALERAAGTSVDLVLVDHVRPAVRWRIARDGIVLHSSPRHAAARFLARTGIEHDALRDLEHDAMRRYRDSIANASS